MFESIREDILEFEMFVLRLFRYFLIATLLLFFSLLPGVMGFQWVGGLSLKQALINSVSILGTVDAPYKLLGEGGQIFTAFYGLFTEIVFLLALGILVAPFIHRMYHKFHIRTE